MTKAKNLNDYDSSSSGLHFIDEVKAIYQKRELLALLVSKDLKSRYRRSFLGIVWTLINPLVSSLVLWIVFVSVFKSKLSNGTQFAPYLLAGVLTISFFTQGMLQAAESISSGLGLFLKIRVDPKLFAISSVLSNAVNFLLGIIALMLISIISGSKISVQFPLVLIVGFSLVMLTTGLGLIFSILFIRFNDIKYIVTVILNLVTYMTPVFYPKEALGEHARNIVSLNPLTSFLDVFRHVFNQTVLATPFDWIYMLGTSLTALFFGYIVFNKSWAKTVVML